MSNGEFANVIIDISHEKIDRSFAYRIPEELKGILCTGDCVSVPFGKYNALQNAYVISITDKCEFDIDKLKYIDHIVPSEQGIDADEIKLARWIKKTYGSTMIAALKTVLPAKKVVKMKEKKEILRTMSVDQIYALYAEALRKNQQAKVRVLNELRSEEILPYDLVVNKLHISASTLNSLHKDGAINIESVSFYRNPVKVTDRSEDKKILSEEQSIICQEIIRDIDSGINVSNGGGRYLIHGITGSGKTEVYLRLIEEVVARGRQCIMLIPEIALTYQTLLRFYKRFGDRVSVINSSLSAGERYDQCMRAKNGDIDVIIGPRSALFVPFPNLGMVIIDEEHESSYLSDKAPKYHARETAEELCRIKNASLVLGSATPSVESYYMAQKGIYKLYKMTRRLTGGELASVKVVDLRQELKKGNRSVFSAELKNLIADRLQKKEQILLFLNRRGYSGFISCRECGQVIKCPHCDVSLSKHRGGKLICHYCGYETEDIKRCPSCGSKYISGFKAGTQQIEDALYKEFPGIRVLRMDADTTKTKSSYENILEAFGQHEADVLVGTQMIVKGHDFPLVTLVGVIAADISLNESDFKTGERTFQLLTQAVGRAGRGTRKGEAIIQTYRPDHYSIDFAKNQDYEGFYEEELCYRAVGDYPPCGKMIKIQVQSKDEKRALALANALKRRAHDKVRCMGPSPDGISKVNDYYRYNLYIKSQNEELLIQSRTIMEEYLDTAPLVTESVSFDVL